MNNINTQNDIVLSFVSEIERKVPINDVIRNYAGDGVKQSEHTTRYNSIFDDSDDEQSLYVHDLRNSWKCFKSGKGGNVIDFIVHAKALKSNLSRNFNSDSYAIAIDQILEEYSDILNQK